MMISDFPTTVKHQTKEANLFSVVLDHWSFVRLESSLAFLGNVVWSYRRITKKKKEKPWVNSNLPTGCHLAFFRPSSRLSIFFFFLFSFLFYSFLHFFYFGERT
jgi:hypothetical protein